MKLAGRFIRLPIAKLETAKRKSSTLMDAFARYADCLFAQTVQSVACNAAHSIEERAANGSSRSWSEPAMISFPLRTTNSQICWRGA